ncbi:hypothetical protein WJX75_000282 [Coccomyxa subellipsoidea]|uniref:Photolyase/cryptochrome alpha/beta domain-containing protein n=1 Tax=Coccomyxa subellipsoidea TaxID=248742 RepID=A0ABR2YSD1_9CHLO
MPPVVVPQHSILWFRKGLRLHDNPSLLAAIKGATHLYPVFILDPWFLKPDVVGVNRLNFLLDSLTDLRSSLQARGSNLLVLRGNPQEVLPRVWKDWNITRLCFEADTEDYAKERDGKITAAAKESGIEVISCVSHTLYNTRDVVAKNGGKAPLTYKGFEKAIAALGPPEPPAEDPPAKLPPIGADSKGTDSEKTGVPSVRELGYPDEASTDIKGGETEALARLAEQLSDKAWVAAFEKPKGDPTAFIKPATTVLSPHLKFGCLSPRLFYEALQRVYSEKKEHSKPPVSLLGQLLWREFYYVVAAHTPNYHRMEGNPICKQIPWDDNEDFYRAWEESRTGYPWIDAIMAQLRRTGWMHHLARHCVACFLTRGDLYVSWERGRDTFDRWLIDGDSSLNTGNWMWLSASSFFYQYFRVYSPLTYGKKYDPEGKYVKHFLPILKDYPAKYIWEPWKAPLKVQEDAGCIIGKDYPAPIVDHDEASKRCIQRMKQAYDCQPGKAAQPVSKPAAKRLGRNMQDGSPMSKRMKRSN